MSTTFTAEVEVTIQAPVAQVWDALINPEMIKQYLFGTTAISDWKVGSPIVYKGEWEGKEYEDHGTILAIEPEKLLDTTYWSAAYGLPDEPENYSRVTYTLDADGDHTTLHLTQDNCSSEESKKKSEDNWTMVLNGLKDLLEKAN